MKKIISSLMATVIGLSMTSVVAQNPENLWPNGTPNDNGHDNEATITVYHPAESNNTGMAVVVCPGGGYTHLAMDHEGKQVAEWLADNGITGVVLKYRLPHGNYTIPADDAREAIRTVRRNAAKWGVNPEKVGIAGSSAGGHLASTVSTHITDVESRPDFSVLFYPVITSQPGITHQGSIDNLLGDLKTDPKMLAEYANELRVDTNTPPAILFLSDDDRAVKPENSIRYYRALKANGVPASMHIFPVGGHGWGFRPTFKYHEPVKTLLIEWLTAQNQSKEPANK